MLEFAILGLLHQSPMHGYELRKQLSQVLGGLRSISYGSLYPALKRMHAAGLISTDEPDPRALLPADAPPLTGRRGKVVYTITAEGKERFHELVCDTGPEAYDDGGLFGVRLAFFRHTASDVRLRDPRGPPAHRRAAARGAAVLAGADPGTARPLHARAPAPRPGVGGPRGPLAVGADRFRAP